MYIEIIIIIYDKLCPNIIMIEITFYQNYQRHHILYKISTYDRSINSINKY